MKKTLIIALCLVTLAACSNQTTNKASENSSTEKNSSTESLINTSNTYNFGSLVIVNNGLVEEDLELISNEEICQKFKDNAYKVDFELTNNFEKEINFTGKTLNDVWTTSGLMTTRMSELGFEGINEQDPSNIASIMQTDLMDIKCFSQQNNRLNIQPGETKNYPLYFSVPPEARYEEETVTIILGPDMHDYSDPTNTEDFSSDNIELIQFEI